MKNNYSREIAAVVDTYLKDNDWHYFFDDETGIFRFGLKVRGRIKNLNFVMDVKEEELLVYGLCPVSADSDDAEMMNRMGEFICRANYGLKNGDFEFDYNDGEIRYKSYVDCEDLLPSPAVVENTIHRTAAMYRRYSAGIVGIIFENLSAREAISRCEDDQESEIRSLLEGLGDIDPKTLEESLMRLAEQLGIPGDEGSDSDGDETDALEGDGGESGDPITFHTDLFSKKEDSEE